MATPSTSVWIAMLGLVGHVYYDFVIFFDDFDSKFMIWCSNFSRMVVDAKTGIGRKNMFSC